MCSDGKISLKIIEKRLNHLREELKNLNSSKLEHHVQYKKRLNQLLKLYDKQIKNLNLWNFYSCHRIEQIYAYELHQAKERLQRKQIDFKLKLISTLNDKRRYLEIEHQNVNIHSRYLFINNDHLNKNTHDINHHSNESNHSQQQQRPTYNLRRTVTNDIISDNLSIFNRSNSLLPLFDGIELQRCLSNNDIEQDIKDIQYNLGNIQSIIEKKPNDILPKSHIDVHIEDGRLWYQQTCFARNSSILLVFNDLEIVPGLILTIGRNDLLIRRLGTNIKHRISLSLLYNGHLAIRKRNCNT